MMSGARLLPEMLSVMQRSHVKLQNGGRDNQYLLNIFSGSSFTGDEHSKQEAEIIHRAGSATCQCAEAGEGGRGR